MVTNLYKALWGSAMRCHPDDPRVDAAILMTRSAAGGLLLDE